jgi:hypothetical protein
MPRVSQAQRKVNDVLLAYLNVFEEHPQGIKVKDHLVTELLQIQSFVKKDPYHTAFNEGRRSVVIEILHNIEQGKLVRKGKPHAGRDSSYNPDDPTDPAAVADADQLDSTDD